MEEMERLKSIHPTAANNNNSDMYENDRNQQLESEVQRLSRIVEEMKTQQNGGFPPMQLEWSNNVAKEQKLPLSPSPVAKTNTWNPTSTNKFNTSTTLDDSALLGSRYDHHYSTPYAYHPSQQIPEERTVHNVHNTSNQQSNQVNNNLFVLSCAPINGFQKMLSQTQEANNTRPMSLIEQANRFAEMNALFQLPTQLSPDDPIFQQQREFELERKQRAFHAREQRDKLQNSIEGHKDRLQKSRNTPRRFPIDAKPSMVSPRASKMQHSVGRGGMTHQEVYAPLAIMDGTEKPRSPHQHHSHHSPTKDMMSTSELYVDQISNLGSTMGSVVLEDGNMSPTQLGDKRPKTIEFEEFQGKTERMGDELKKLVRDAVHDEMVADGHAQHYTKRFMNKLMATKQETLVDRIEKQVADKIEKLQKELEELRDQKVKKPKKSANGHDDEDTAWMSALENLDVEGLDVKELSSAINRTVEITLKHYLTGGPLQVAPEVERYGSSEGYSTRISSSSRDKPPTSARIHGRISAEIPPSSSSSNQDTGRDSIGFESSIPEPTNFYSASTTAPIVAPVPEPVVDVYEEPPKKPKSKADRLLGISSDPKSGLPVNTTPVAIPSATGDKHGLFGSIGSLFSSKPGSLPPGVNGPNHMAMPGQSERGGQSSRPTPSTHVTMHSPVKAAAGLGTIVDEEGEEQSEKKSVHGSMKKDRKGSKGNLKDKDKSKTRDSFGSSDMSMKKSASSTSVAVTMNPQLAAEIANEEINYRTLMANLLSLADVKVNIKKELKDWQTDFKSKFGREATVEDKMAINDRFIAYKMVCNQVQEAKDLVKVSEDKLKELRERQAQ